MSDTDDLKKWVQKAAAGDGKAFEKLYKETCRSVYFTCFGFLKDEQEAQDVTQDVYLTAYEQMGTLEDAGKFKPWLYRIAANKSMNLLKKKQPLLLGDEQLADMDTEENENFLPEEYALNADKRELVLKIVQKTCSDVLYQTILLHYFNELSIAEIAEIMGCLEGTVKYRLSAARAKIKEGVLRYEKKSGDKLYSVAAVPFLTAWFTAQLNDMRIPPLSPSFLGALPQSTLAASTAKTGGSMILKSLQLKIVAGIAAAVVAAGGVTAAAVIIHNQNAQEASAEAQEGNTQDMADAGNTADTENPPEASTPEPEDVAEPETETEVPAETEAEETIEPETTEADAEETPEPTADTTPEPETTYTYTEMETTMYAKSSVNVRDLPSTDGGRVGGLSTNDEVLVTGQCNETGWYRFEYNGQTAYVSNNYLSDSTVEVAQANSGGSSSVSSSSEPCPYTLNVWTIHETEYGLKVYEIYTTKNNLTDILYSEPLAENHYLFTERDEQGLSIFGKEIFAESNYLDQSTGVFHGMHFVYPIVKVGTYAEGTVYKCSAGAHYTNIIDPERSYVDSTGTYIVTKCPNYPVGCQPGTIN